MANLGILLVEHGGSRNTGSDLENGLIPGEFGSANDLVPRILADEDM